MSAEVPDLEPVVVRRATSADDFQQVIALRRRVFQQEQGIVDTQLNDADDPVSVHVIAVADGEVVAAGRLTPPQDGRPEAQIAWVATLPAWRVRGIGTAVMEALLAEADAAMYPAILLSAQTHALRFYTYLGFQAYGNRFDVRGIEHQYMERRR